MKRILELNSNQKYIEFILSQYDNAPSEMTMKELRKKFEGKFKFNQVMLNQYFGIMRILPLILIKQEYADASVPLEGDIEKIKVIRDSISHNDFEISSEGYTFKNKKNTIRFSFDDFLEFIHKIENDFYKDRIKDGN
ncbi:hypothetical protein [Marinicrinis sediminis]|uniref:pEK499-p136 HEPN domain-containing protein n=1 Tax=Marinicrinis sediminis TaxID=1652465 RepID=A0ABW5REZ5_9BACL